MHVQRLKRLIKVLEGLRPEQLDLNVYAKKTDCGTVACAVGWGAMDPELASQGLELRGCVSDKVFYISFDGEDGRSAIKSFFGLSWSDTRIFYGEHYLKESYSHYWQPDITAQDVIMEIKNLLTRAPASETGD